MDVKSKYDAIQQLTQGTVSGVSKACKSVEVFLTKPSDSLDKHYQSALELYAQLQKRSAEQRPLENHIEMTKVIVRVLKSRDQLFAECFTQIRWKLLNDCSTFVGYRLTIPFPLSDRWRRIRPILISFRLSYWN